MSPPGVETPTIPARISARALGKAIGVPVDQVLTVMGEYEDHLGPDDFVEGETAVSAAAALGFTVEVEPRDLALEALYAHETKGTTPEVTGRAARLFEGVLADLDGLDERIESVSEHWSVSRMPVIDRNILRMALHELEREAEVPTGVVLAEAVRLASAYSTEKSASFVNGVLATLARTSRAD